MNFNEALELMKQGKKVKRRKWGGNAKYYIAFSNVGDYLVKFVYLSNNPFEDMYFLSKEDTLSDDWEEYKEPLLTENDKSCISAYIKYNRYVITNILNDGRSLQFRTETNNIVGSYYYEESMFRKLDLHKSYTLKELGLEE